MEEMTIDEEEEQDLILVFKKEEDKNVAVEAIHRCNCRRRQSSWMTWDVAGLLIIIVMTGITLVVLHQETLSLSITISGTRFFRRCENDH